VTSSTRVSQRIAAACAGAIVLASCQVSNQQVGGLFGAGLGGLVGSQIGSGTGNAVATILGIGIGALVGSEIGRYLDEQDRVRMAAATEGSAVSGAPRAWVNPDTGVSGRTEVVRTTTEEARVPVKVLRDRVTATPPIELVQAPYRAVSDTNVRGGPGTDYVIVGSLSSGEVVEALGLVEGKPWYMIAEGGVATGYVHQSTLALSEGAMTQVASSPAGEVSEVTVDGRRTCRSINQTVTMADGTEHDDQVTVCNGPNGWEIV
jgi:outer membrane lipoprotein SlyB/uncharacterized protein YraI